MSNKNRLKEDKSNPIVSKLLGAHPSEISVEKLKDKVMKIPEFKLNGKISTEILKMVSGKFDCNIIFHLSIIFYLDLSN
jgi:hypothetical protein